MGRAGHAEIERKYAVDENAVLPSLLGLPGVAGAGPQQVFDLDATYFDTAGLDLARARATLRRRTGGDDAGWHLKLGVDREERTELHRPLGEAPDDVPPALLDPVRVTVRDRPLAPVATIRTHRIQYDLLGENGDVLAIVCDDRVHGERAAEPGGDQADQLDPAPRLWREWEVELVGGDRDLFAELERVLGGAGGRRVEGGSKLLQTLGESVSAQPAARQAAAWGSPRSTGRFLQDQLTEHLAAMHRQDRRVRAGHPNGVHRLRVASRKLRSMLATYRPVLDAERVAPVRAELQWLGQSLAPARDAEVLRDRLRAEVAEQPTELVMGPVLARIDLELGAAARDGGAAGLQALRSERYYRLLDALDALVDDPPLTARAHRPARGMVARLLRRDVRRAKRAVDELADATDPDDRDRRLHEVRKKAKRLRYAATAAKPLYGSRARRLARTARAVQQCLGEHQDSVVARRTLRELAAQSYLHGENGFTFGRLHALEESRAAQAESRFADLWRAVPQRRVRRFLRS